MIDPVKMDTKEWGKPCSQIYTTNISQSYLLILAFDLRKQMKFIVLNV